MKTILGSCLLLLFSFSSMAMDVDSKTPAFSSVGTSVVQSSAAARLDLPSESEWNHLIQNFILTRSHTFIPLDVARSEVEEFKSLFNQFFSARTKTKDLESVISKKRDAIGLAQSYFIFLSLAYEGFDKKFKSELRSYSDESEENHRVDIYLAHLETDFKVLQNISNIVFQALRKWYSIDLSQREGVVEINEIGSIVYFQDEGGIVPVPNVSTLDLTPRYVLWGKPEEFQKAFLLKNHNLVIDSGISITYDNNNKNTLRLALITGKEHVFPHSRFIVGLKVDLTQKLGKKLLTDLLKDAEINKEGKETLVAFLRLPQNSAEWAATYLNHLEEICTILSNSQNLGFNKALIQKDQIEIQAVMTLENLKEDVSQHLITHFEREYEETIRKEQEARSQAVADGSIHSSGSRPAQRSKNRHRPKKMSVASQTSSTTSSSTNTSSTASGGESSAKQNNRLKAQALFEDFKVKTGLKYRNVLKVIARIRNTFPERNLDHVTINGSHLNFHLKDEEKGTGTGITLVRSHGTQDIIPAKYVNNLVRSLIGSYIFE